MFYRGIYILKHFLKYLVGVKGGGVFLHDGKIQNLEY